MDDLSMEVIDETDDIEFMMQRYQSQILLPWKLYLEFMDVRKNPLNCRASLEKILAQASTQGDSVLVNRIKTLITYQP